MNKMCQACSSELTKSDNVGDDPVLACKLCQDQEEKYRQESSKKQEGLTPYVTPLISPTISLHSTNSFVSSCSELLVDEDDLGVKEDANNGVPDTGQEILNPAKGIDGSDTIPVEYVEDNITDHNQYMINNITSKDIEITGEASSLEGTEYGVDTELSHSVDIDRDPDIWLLPEAEGLEDEMESNVADSVDDVEYSGGTRWGEPCSPSRFGEECNGSIRFKEQRQKAMEEVMNGEFKGFVSRLLTLVGISSLGEAGENWVDIVTSLSWKAALLVKPEAVAGKTMDPKGFVKVKCIATGSRSQSHLIKGLVFKKNTAHKHMRTKYKNPRLLLLQGMLGESSSGFLSFDSMEREKDNLKSIIEMIDITHPNVVLVEKSVSRDVQESLVAKGITLVFDMKLHRLERIARCTGSQIVSSTGSLMNQKLKQCDFFHFEKFVEEHNISEEGGKKPSKTLMFLEGCIRSLGCTILLKGAHSDELKRIKSVVHYTVIVAYHFILETSFLVDQRATFSTFHSGIVDGFPKAEQHLIVGSGSSATIDIPICDGFGVNSAYDGVNFNPNMTLKGNSTLLGFRGPAVNSYENDVGEYTKIHHNVSDNRRNHQLDMSNVRSPPTILQGQLLSSLSVSLKKVIEDSLPLISSASRQSFSKYFGFKEREEGYQNTAVLPAFTSPEVLTSHEMEEGKARADELSDSEQVESLSTIVEVPSEQQKSYSNNEDEILHKDDIDTVLDAQSILILMSSRSISRGTSCEQSHLSRIKYYRNFDVSLERFLCKVLLNQTHRCSACGEPPEAHSYSYMHQRGKLTVRVKQIPTNGCLPGEAEGKLWMWIRCLKCEQPTRRVVISTATRSLSFGKFMELSFSSHSTAHRLSRCGNSLHRDYLCFYGLGPMVAMFRYSSVKIYSACMPLPVLEFNNPIGQDWIEKEAEKVLKKGSLLFTEVSNSLQKLRSGGWSSPTSSQLDLAFTVEGISEIEEMLKVERCDFEAQIQKVVNKNEHRGQDMHEILCLNGIIQELVLKSYIWDRRLCFLLFPERRIFTTVTTNKMMSEEQVQMQKDGIGHGRIEEQMNYPQYFEKNSDGTTATIISPISDVMSSAACDDDNVVDHSGSAEAESLKALDETFNEVNENSGNKFLVSKSQFGSPRLESVHPNNSVNSSIDDEASDRPQMAHINTNGFSSHEWTATTSGILSDYSILGQHSSGGLSHLSAGLPLHGESCDYDNLLNSIPSQVHQSIPISEESLTDTDCVANLRCHGSDMGEISNLLEPAISTSQKSILSNIDGSQSGLWSPFSEIHKVYKKDIQKGCLQKFEFINIYTPEVLSSANQLITEEGSRLHISLGPDDNVVSLYEDELTSIIACALAMSQDQHGSADDLVEEGRNVRGDQYDKIIENARSLPSDISTASPYWFSNGSLDAGVPAGGSVSSEESYTSSFDLSKLMGLLPSLEALHPEINLGAGKSPGKGKYSVVCVYGKQFRALRRRCCPCEGDYIASLSRCKNWDAKGGKSGSLFLKTLDDRFIVKQIKKTEFDSFLKFAPDYFKYINHSLSSGSQTCLAKILGIYQVTVRQAKGGKDLKYDLMIMENLVFGRSITRLYDLKGAQHGRYTSDADDAGNVFLDENFVEDMNLSPLYVSGKSKLLLQRAVWNDTSFLTSINVMDYSLLVGVDMQRGELVCGIIDYLRQYTWDKHLETWVKASLVVPKNVSPTVISPKEYKKRFRKFMSMYFLSIPDSWCSERSPDPCKFCGERSYGSTSLERKFGERK